MRVDSLIRSYLLAIATVISVLLVRSPTAAEEPIVSPDYPGLKANGGLLVVASSEVQAAVAAYQKVFGRMPDSWREVRESGLFDKPLHAFDMQEIDPDDSSIDFRGDLYLDFQTLREESTAALLLSLWAPQGNEISRTRIEKTEPYEFTFNAIRNYLHPDEYGLSVLDAWQADEAQRIQFGQIHMLMRGLWDYKDIRGEYPQDLQQLVAAGLGPLTAGSLNPVTGEPYRFDGSPGDILYERSADGTGFALKHIDANFNPAFGMSY